MKLTMMGRKRFNELPQDVQDLFASLDDTVLVHVNSILHGGIISAGFSRQKEIAPYLKFIYPSLESINGVWDFVDHTAKMYIDSKSKGYDNNTPVHNTAAKYKEANKEGYGMLLVITNATKWSDVGWPVEKYKAEGINIKLLTEL